MLKVKNDNYLIRVQEKIESNVFMRHMGFKITEIEVGKITGEMPVLPHLYQQDSFVHGGAVATVADIVTGFSAYTLAAEDEYIVTAEIKISYFKPAVGDKISAVGWVLKAGSRMHFCEGEVYAHKGGKKVLIAKATTTMAIIKK